MNSCSCTDKGFIWNTLNSFTPSSSSYTENFILYLQYNSIIDSKSGCRRYWLIHQPYEPEIFNNATVWKGKCRSGFMKISMGNSAIKILFHPIFLTGEINLKVTNFKYRKTNDYSIVILKMISLDMISMNWAFKYCVIC